MNKYFLMFVILTLAIPITAKADFNYTCERDCSVQEVSISCGTLNPSAYEYLVNISGNLTPYNLTYYFMNESNGLLNTSTRTEFLSTPDFTSSDVELEPDTCYFTSSYLREVINSQDFNTSDVYNNWTFRLLKGDSEYYTDWTCVNSSVRLTNNDVQNNYDTYDLVLNCERGEITDFEIERYSTTDGTCGGTRTQTNQELLTILGDSKLCEGFNELQFNYPNVTGDLRYRIKQYDYVHEEECILTFLNQTSGGFNSEFVPYGVGTNGGTLRYADGGTNYTCPVSCDGTSYALNLVREISPAISGESLGYYQVDQYYRYIWTFEQLYTNWTECENPIYYCSSWGTPYNTSLTYGCDCPPDLFDYGLYCSGSNCYGTCSGEFSEDYYYNESGTFTYAIQSGEPTEVISYVTNEITQFFGSVMPVLSNLMWVIIFIVVLFVFVGMILYLFGG